MDEDGHRKQGQAPKNVSSGSAAVRTGRYSLFTGFQPLESIVLGCGYLPKQILTDSPIVCKKIVNQPSKIFLGINKI